MPEADVIVVGLGAAGSAALYQLARRGRRVIGVDQFAPPHAMGSSHGETRITRLAIGEGAHYTPLAIRSHQIWRELEAATGRELLTENGGLVISGAGGGSRAFHGASFFATTVAAAQRHGIDHERLDAAQIRRRFPAFAVRDDEVGYFEPSAGFVRPEACVAAQLDEAARLGASLRLGETVLGFADDGGGVVVETTAGRYTATALVLAVGPWAPRLYGDRIAAPLKVFRQVLYWFDVGDAYASFTPDRFPVFIWELPHAHGAIYGFPAVGGPDGGFKIATEQYAAETSPERVSREVTAAETAEMFERFVAPFFPDARPRCVRSAVCLYTMTPDFGFVVDRLPGAERVIVASPCSGHGFKHSAALGEAIADLAEGRASRFDLSAFALSRFAA
jgi:sarcosine oxidase